MKKVKVVQYGMELDGHKHPKLIEENTYDYLQKEEDFDYFAVTTMLCSCFRLADKAEEYLYVLGFTAKGGLLGVFEVAHGAGSGARINFREIMQRMLLVGASGFILAHNHPSGDPTPSGLDLKACREAVRAGDFMGLPCLDFIIVGRDMTDGSCLSFSFFSKNLLKEEAGKQ